MAFLACHYDQGWFLDKWAVSEVCLKCKIHKSVGASWKCGEQRRNPSWCLWVLVCNAVSTRLDKAQHLFLFSWVIWRGKKKEKDIATAVKHMHLRQGRKDFIGWSTQQPHLSLQGALMELWGWGVETNAWPTWETETEVQAGSCWNPWCLSCRQACESTKMLGYLTAQPCLSCVPQMWGEEGDYNPLQTCQRFQGFALSSFAKYSQGFSLGFNKSSTISGLEGIGSWSLLPHSSSDCLCLSTLDSASWETSCSHLSGPLWTDLL